MNWLGYLLTGATLAGLTGGGYAASQQGWGLPGKLAQPVSIRQQSVSRNGRTSRPFMYFGSRRHSHGGFRGGK